MTEVNTFLLLLAAVAALASAHSRASPPKVVQKIYVTAPPSSGSTLASHSSSSSCCKPLTEAEAAFDSSTDILATNWTILGEAFSSNYNRFLNGKLDYKFDEIKRQIAQHLHAFTSLLNNLKTKESLSCYTHRANSQIAAQQLQLSTLNLITSCYEPKLKKIMTTTPKPTTTTHRPEKLLERKTQLKVNPNVMDVLHSGILDGVIVEKN